ncbi:MAG TPA: hypothetical protein VJ921_15620 [Vicinamibacteria bacterium]|nr:hypothetical protein [Vicinamibacteria bacterium]
MRRVSLFLLAAGVASLACGRAPSPWTELDSLEDLKAVFQRDAGKPRIVLLLSPT